MMITDVRQAELERAAQTTEADRPRTPGDVLADLAKLEQYRMQLDDLHAELAKLHRPRKVSGGQIRCTECATYVNGALRRTEWPCPTERARRRAEL
jgi:hypothetical protein